jgi:CDP-4-dehydro-6-deoxyglucose reductase, E1
MTYPAEPLVPYRLAADTFNADEIEAAQKVLSSGRLTMGPEVSAFEAEFATWIDAEHALMVNSGSSANPGGRCHASPLER